MTMRSRIRFAVAMALVAAVSVWSGSGCPSGPGPIATITNIAVQKDGFVSAGDGIIAYGKSSGGVAWLNVSTGVKTDIAGSFPGDAIYCSGKKIVLVADGAANSVSIHDTTTGTTTAVPNTDVFDIAPGSLLENQYIAVDNQFCAILHRGTNSTELKLIDFAGSTPAVKTYTAALLAPNSVDIDGVNGQIVVMEDNRYLSIFETTAAANANPTTYDLQTDAGTNIAYFPNTRISGGFIMFPDFNTRAARLVRIADGTLFTPTENPTTSDLTQFTMRGGAFIYYLNRPAQDDFESGNGYRSALGFLSAPTTITVGPGTNLGGGIRAGFGLSAAILEDGSAAFLAGRFGQSSGGGVNDPTALQGNFGQGYELITDSQGNAISAGDVSASNNVVAFKVENGAGALLGYHLP